MTNPTEESAVVATVNTDERKKEVYAAAKRLNSVGLSVLPVRVGGKELPPSGHGVNFNSAARRPETVEKWFNPKHGKYAGWNISVGCGGMSGVMVLDLDVKKGGKGIENLNKWMDEKGERLPLTFVTATPSGGVHYYFKRDERLRLHQNKVLGIDLQSGSPTSNNSQVLVPPSTFEGRPYEWIASPEDVDEIPPMPEWLIQKLMEEGYGAFVAKPNSSRGGENVSDADLYPPLPKQQIIDMLQSTSAADLGHDEWLNLSMAYKYACEYAELDTSLESEMFSYWDEWCERDPGGHDEKKDPKRWATFKDERNGPMATTASLFFHAKQAEWEPKENDVLPNKFIQMVDKMNESHAVVLSQGRVRILKEKPKDGHNMPFDMISRQDFRTLYENDVICTDEEKGKYTSKADIWLGNSARRTYPSGIGLYPEGAPDGAYNTWQGLTAFPVQGDCHLFLEHCHHIICNGNDEHYQYLLDWMAFTFQHPGSVAESAVVMRGPEGTGKGTWANEIGKIFGPHYIHLINTRHLLGNFNAHMIDALFVFADELEWRSSAKTSGVLKGLVTEKYLTGERKGYDAFSYQNKSKLAIASNEEWVIPAGADSRRWFVLDVSDKYALPNKEKTEYFAAIHEELNNGGREALLHEMLDRKIPDVLPQPPVTDALKEQRQLTDVNHIKDWFWHQLEMGFSHGVTGDGEHYWDKDVAFGDYREWTIKHSASISNWEKKPVNSGRLLQAVNKMLKKHRAPTLCTSRPKINGKRVYVWTLPPRTESVWVLASVLGLEGSLDDPETGKIGGWEVEN